MQEKIIRPLQENEQLYFIHVPKCAGTSFISLVDERYVIDEIIPTHYDINKLKNQITDEQLASYRFIRGHLPYDLVVPRLPKKPRIITFLREPITRLISNFQMRQRVPDPLVGLQSTLSRLSLDEFLDQPDLVRVFANRATRLIGGVDKLDSGKQVPNLELAKQRLAEFDFVGTVERFNDSLQLFCYIFDFPLVKTERNLNISPNREARSDIPATLLERIAEVEWADIELYKFGARIFEKKYAVMQETKKSGVVDLDLHKKMTAANIDFSRVDPGSGWHVAERHPKHGVVRWSGPDKVSYLRLPLSLNQPSTVRFGVLRAADRDILESLVLEVNGMEIPLHKKRSGLFGDIIFEGNIPSEAMTSENLVEFAFKVDRTVPLERISQVARWLRHFLDKQYQDPEPRFGGLLFHWFEVNTRQ